MGAIIRIKEVQLGNESLTVYRSEGGGIFGIDSSAVESDACTIYNPFTGKPITPEELDHADTKTEPITWNCCEGELGRDDTCRICGEGYDD